MSILGILSPVGVLVRIQQSEYSVSENEDSLEVCAELQGMTQIPISVALVTLGVGSAASKFRYIFVDVNVPSFTFFERF